MLVLSRRETEKVLFPTLGVSIEVLRVRGNTTKLGIDAPASIPIIRHEVARRKSVEFALDEGSSSEQLSELAHAVRQRLSGAANALNQLHKEMDASGNQAVQEIVMRLYADLEALEHEANSVIEWSSKAKALQILLVEDSVVERKLLAGALELSGLNVRTADDGHDALNYLSMHAMPDAVLLDMLMPRCDGPSFVREVRSNPQLKSLKIFAVSSIEPSTLGLVTGEEGIDGWFPKPLEPAQLVSVLDERLNKSVAVA